MKDVKVINLTIKQLIIALLIIITVLTTYAQMQNSSITKIAEEVKESNNEDVELSLKNELKTARISEIQAKARINALGEKTELLAKRELSDTQVVTRSALTERKKDVITQQSQEQQSIQQEELQELQSEVLQAPQSEVLQEEILDEQQNVEIVSSEVYIEVVQQETYKTIEEVTISKNMDLTVRTGLSKEDFKTLISRVKQDKTKFFYNNSDIIYDLCQEYQLNEIFFCGLISAESGWEIASSHRNTHNYISLMSRGKLIRYNSVEEGLRVAAQKLHNNYLSENGKYYNGKTLAGVKVNFCPDSSKWINLVYSGMQQIVKNK